MDVVAALLTRSLKLLLPADVAALSARSPPNLLLPAGVVAAQSARSKTKKAMSWGLDGILLPLDVLLTGCVIVASLNPWCELDSDAKQHPQADFEPRYARAQSG